MTVSQTMRAASPPASGAEIVDSGRRRRGMLGRMAKQISLDDMGLDLGRCSGGVSRCSGMMVDLERCFCVLCPNISVSGTLYVLVCTVDEYLCTIYTAVFFR